MNKRVSKPRDKREIKAITLVLGGVFVVLYFVTWLTMTTVAAGETVVLEEQAVAIRQAREDYARELFDAEFYERAEKIMPIIESTTMSWKQQAEELRALELGFEMNQEFANEEAERLDNLSADRGAQWANLRCRRRCR